MYERIWFGAGARHLASSTSPSDEDRLVVVHSFSKSFLMTGWRLGWLVLPRGHLDAIGKLIEFNTSCAPVFVQRGGLAALGHGATLSCRRWCNACASAATGWSPVWPRCRASKWPARAGGMYAFFRVEGEGRFAGLCQAAGRTGHGLGLAPGVAFGAEGEGWLRWCFASRDPQRLDAGVARLAGPLPYNPQRFALAAPGRRPNTGTIRVGFTCSRKWNRKPSQRPNVWPWAGGFHITRKSS